MTYRIKLIGLGRKPTDKDGMYLVSAGIDSGDMIADVRATPLPELAMTFDSFAAALEYWKRQSTVRPLRPDGKPNRPFTAWSVEIEQGKEGTDARPVGGNTDS